MAIRILAQRGVIVLPSGISITPGMNVAKVVGDPVAWSAFQADVGGAAPTVQVSETLCFIGSLQGFDIPLS
jgi:hypothetical protein